MKKRPSVKGRSVVIRIRMTAPEYRLLRQMSDRADLTVSGMVRKMTEVHARIETEVLRQEAERAAGNERALIQAAHRIDSEGRAA